MKKMLLAAGLVIVLIAVVAAYALSGAVQAPAANEADLGMPVPGVEGVEESIVTNGMAVPGVEGVEERIAGEE